jgi:hypothetical protein
LRWSLVEARLDRLRGHGRRHHGRAVLLARGTGCHRYLLGRVRALHDHGRRRWAHSVLDAPPVAVDLADGGSPDEAASEGRQTTPFAQSVCVDRGDSRHRPEPDAAVERAVKSSADADPQRLEVQSATDPHASADAQVDPQADA